MSTVGEVVDATINRWLVGTYRTKSNVLDAALDASATSVVCAFPPNVIGEGSFLAIDDELMEVTRAAQNLTLNVIRGVRGTTAAIHASGSKIEINPRYPRLSVRAAMLDEIVAWPESLFTVSQVESSPGALSGTIDVGTLVPGTIRRILAVYRSGRTGDDRSRAIDWTSAKDARGPGSCDLYLHDRMSSGRSYQIVVGTDFFTDFFEDDASLQDDVGVPRSCEDIVQMGAAWRLVTGREAKRLYTEAQGESRESAETGSLDLARFGIQLMQLRDAAIAREAKRLKDRYGTGITGG